MGPVSDATYLELVKAGAPVLPDGWFYRVRWNRGDLGPDLIVQVRKHRRFGSTSLSEKRVWVYGYHEVRKDGSINMQWEGQEWATPLELVANTCAHAFGAVRESERKAVAWRALTAELKRLEGDHP